MYEREDFQDSITDVSQSALDRLRNLRENLGDYPNIDEADIVFERITTTTGLAEEGDYTQDTTLELFTNVFGPIHNNLMQEEAPAEYFADIVSTLIRVGIQEREEDAGNILTQLVPDIDELRAHVSKVWQVQSEQRLAQQELVVYNFHFNRDIAQIKFIFDTNDGYWKLGYGSQIYRLLFHWGKNVHEVEGDVFHADPIDSK